MNILLVAPDNPDLPSVAAVIAAISKYHDVKRVIGNVRESDIRNAVETSDEFDIIWFATHGGPEGILISEGMLSSEAIGQYVAASGAALCVLSTCASEDVALRIIAGGDADMVFTITPDVKDDDALRFDSLFARELSKTDNFEEAFRAAAGPGSTKYRYLRARQALRSLAVRSSDELGRMREQLSTLRDAQYRMSVDLTQIQERLVSITQQSLTSQQQTLQSRSMIEENISRLQRDSRAQSGFTPVFWAIVALVAIAIIILIVVYGR